MASLWWTRILEKSSEFLEFLVVIFVYLCCSTLFKSNDEICSEEGFNPSRKVQSVLQALSPLRYQCSQYSGQIERQLQCRWWMVIVLSNLPISWGILELEEMREHACYSPSEVEREGEWKMWVRWAELAMWKYWFLRDVTMLRLSRLNLNRFSFGGVRLRFAPASMCNAIQCRWLLCKMSSTNLTRTPRRSYSQSGETESATAS